MTNRILLLARVKKSRKLLTSMSYTKPWKPCIFSMKPNLAPPLPLLLELFPEVFDAPVLAGVVALEVPEVLPEPPACIHI